MQRTGSWSLLVFLAATLLLSAGACTSLPYRIEGERPFMGEAGPQRKTVAAKEPPSRLVAVDGTVCILSADKFESVEVDDRVWCTWVARGG